MRKIVIGSRGMESITYHGRKYGHPGLSGSGCLFLGIKDDNKRHRGTAITRPDARIHG